MNRRNIKVSDKLDVKGKEINAILSWYCNGEIWVNRKYQRKLVWSLKEKQEFINSILEPLPTPSMILHECETDTELRYEIIDGMQRLNAIFSFIMNEFPVMYNGEMQYFDTCTHFTTFNMVRADKLQQKTPVLDSNICNSFLAYELPLIVTKQADDKIEKIFLRINSSGKKLSSQDLRQSSSCDSFADLVRRIACYTRGEFSFDDEINLMDMPKISVSSRGLNYGIDARTTFWRRHGIITFDNLRQSRDEELIAKIIGEVFLQNVHNPSSDMLDKMYNPDNEYNKRLADAIANAGLANVEDEMRKLFNTIDNVFDAVDSNFSSWCFANERTNNKNDCFRMFYTALFRLQREGYFIDDYCQFANNIKCFADTIMSTIICSRTIRLDDWNKISDAVYAFLKEKLTKRVPHTVTEAEKDIEHRLLLSSVESAMTEFKSGISVFKSGEIKEKTIHRIARALSAMSNTDLNEEGLVIIGVLDNDDDKREWENAYSEKSIRYSNHYVNGVGAEAIKYFYNTDGYIKQIMSMLQEEPMDADLLESVLQGIKEVDFEGRQLILLPSKHFDHQVLYDGVAYVRHGSNDVVLE